MNVGLLMSRVVETCHTGDNLAVAAAKMWDRDIGCLPVIGDDDRIVAVITDRDICMAGYIQGQPLIRIPVAVAMSKELHVCRPEDTLIEAEEAMRAHRVRRLPVVDASGALVGLIALNDLAREAEREAGRKRRDVTGQEVTATLAAIGAARNEGALAAA